MNVVKIVDAIVSRLPEAVLNSIEKEVFKKPGFGVEFNPSDNMTFDVGIVFGGLVERAQKAYELYGSGKIAKVLLSGGVGSVTSIISPNSEAEAEQYLKFTAQYGVPLEDIFIENTSSSTEENAQKSLNLLKENGYDLDTTRILVISSDFHIRRCLRALQKFLPLKQLFWVSVESDYRNNWKTTEKGRFYIFKEFCQNFGR